MKYEEPVKATHIGCLNCGGNEELAPLDMVIAVGFGMACCIKDGAEVYSEPVDFENASDDDYKTVADMEALALADPDHDWRIIKEAPLKSAEWQRQGAGRWVLIKEGQGFA